MQPMADGRHCPQIKGKGCPCVVVIGGVGRRVSQFLQVVYYRALRYLLQFCNSLNLILWLRSLYGRTGTPRGRRWYCWI